MTFPAHDCVYNSYASHGLVPTHSVPSICTLRLSQGEGSQVLAEIDVFQTSLKLSEGRPEYTFYDGPPFATGLPHYGHLLAGTIKVCARYDRSVSHVC